MGSPGMADFTQWSRGEFNGAVNKEDSIAAIQQVIPLRADDAGDTPDSAAKLKVTVKDGVASGKASGIIGQRDRDVYSFTASEGQLRAWANPSGVGANTDLSLTLMDSSGFPIASFAPSKGSVFFPIKRPGTYYLQVTSTGGGDPRSNGYSDYGSLGAYVLEASFVPGDSTAPVAVLTATPTSGWAPLLVSLDARGSEDDGKVESVYWDFGDGHKDNSGNVFYGSYRFEKPGSYSVSIRVVDNEGLSSTTTQMIMVRDPTQKDITAKPRPRADQDV